MKLQIRCALLAVLASIIVSTAASAQKIGLYSDLSLSSCSFTDVPGVRQIHVFYTGPHQATAVRFKAPVPACWTGAVWVGDTLPPHRLSIGDSQSDWSVGVIDAGTSDCASPPTLVGDINVFSGGAAQPCCEMTVQAPGPTWFVYTWCDFGEHPLEAGQKLVINPNASCPCQLPLATETSTWGRVKSLYR